MTISDSNKINENKFLNQIRGLPGKSTINEEAFIQVAEDLKQHSAYVVAKIQAFKAQDCNHYAHALQDNYIAALACILGFTLARDKSRDLEKEHMKLCGELNDLPFPLYDSRKSFIADCEAYYRNDAYREPQWFGQVPIALVVGGANGKISWITLEVFDEGTGQIYLHPNQATKSWFDDTFISSLTNAWHLALKRRSNNEPTLDCRWSIINSDKIAESYFLRIHDLNEPKAERGSRRDHERLIKDESAGGQMLSGFQKLVFSDKPKHNAACLFSLSEKGEARRVSYVTFKIEAALACNKWYFDTILVNNDNEAEAKAALGPSNDWITVKSIEHIDELKTIVSPLNIGLGKVRYYSH